MHTVTVAVFWLLYVGMFAGRLPGLALDRTGVALLGAIVLVVLGEITPEAAWASIDISTLGLLFGLILLEGVVVGSLVGAVLGAVIGMIWEQQGDKE